MQKYFAEHRLCFERLGYLGDLGSTYFAGPVKKGDVYQMVTGTAAGIASVGLEGPDRFIRGTILGEQYEAPDNNPIGHITRDTRLMFSHFGKGEIFQGLGAGISVLATDLPMDILDGISGVRAGASHALAA